MSWSVNGAVSAAPIRRSSRYLQALKPLTGLAPKAVPSYGGKIITGNFGLLQQYLPIADIAKKKPRCPMNSAVRRGEPFADALFAARAAVFHRLNRSQDLIEVVGLGRLERRELLERLQFFEP